jgi:hypothetical protein
MKVATNIKAGFDIAVALTRIDQDATAVAVTRGSGNRSGGGNVTAAGASNTAVVVNVARA